MNSQILMTTVIGDYPKIPNRPRPAKHRIAKEKFQKGDITKQEMAQVEDDVTIEVLKEQAEAGLDVVTDGQIRWNDAQTYFAWKLEGFEITGLIRYFDTNCYYRQPSAVGRIRWKEPIAVTDYRFAREHSTVPVKPVITGPYTLAKLSVYPYYNNFKDFVLDVAEALHQEILVLQNENPPLIQINEPAITWHKEDAELFGEAMVRLTQGVKIPLALSTYFGDVKGLESIIGKLPFQIVGLDMLQGTGNWDVITNAHWDKTLSLGLLDSRNTKMENWEAIFNKLEPVFRNIPPERIMINPNCGLEFLPREVAYAKLVNMVTEVKKFKQKV
jgi:5-methyltetrahydropteroyltriglutamate--homocysteine methyltransferase